MNEQNTQGSVSVTGLVKQVRQLKQNGAQLRELYRITGKLPIPVYVNYEQYGNGLNRYLEQTAEQILAAFNGLGLLEQEADDYAEYYAEYTEGKDVALKKRLIRLLEGYRREREFSGILLLHVDEWLQNERFRSREWEEALEYLDGQRSRVVLMFQTKKPDVHTARLWENSLERHFNITIAESTALDAGQMYCFLGARFTGMGYVMEKAFAERLERVCKRIAGSKSVDQYQQMLLVLEDVVCGKIRCREQDEKLRAFLLERTEAKLGRQEREDAEREIGFCA